MVVLNRVGVYTLTELLDGSCPRQKITSSPRDLVTRAEGDERTRFRDTRADRG
jgi:hypothetical protein